MDRVIDFLEKILWQMYVEKQSEEALLLLNKLIKLEREVKYGSNIYE